MIQSCEQPFFSVVMPTRNRPGLFERALNSVLAQSCKDFEVIVVNDGSDDHALRDYREIESAHGDRVRWHYQPQRPNGHGQSYSMNTGALNARGRFLAFLDDDDTWEDREHLARAKDTLATSDPELQVWLTNQRAYTSQGEPLDETLWIGDLADKLHPGMAINGEACRVDTEFLLGSRGFAHLNCTIVARELYLGMQGMDENIRYECDRDFYLRLIDKADHMAYHPAIVARHNIPDPRRKDNMSTLVSDLEKRLYQITLLEKAVLFSARKAVRRYGRNSLANTLRHGTETLVKTGRHRLAKRMAWQALSWRYSFKWHLYCMALNIRSAVAEHDD